MVLMHSRRARAVTTELGGQYRGVRYDDVAGDVLYGRGWSSWNAALAAGIAQQALIFRSRRLGSGRRLRAERRVAARIWRGCARSGLPLLVGVSRKSFIGELTGRPPAERLEGSLAAAVAAVAKGADMVRVHDVGATRRALAVADALLSRGGRVRVWARGCAGPRLRAAWATGHRARLALKVGGWWAYAFWPPEPGLGFPVPSVRFDVL